MKKLFLFICLMVTLAACERDAENKAESSLVGTTWTREYDSKYWSDGLHTSIQYTAHEYVVFTSATEMLFDFVGRDSYSEFYTYTLDGSDLTLEFVKKIPDSSQTTKGSFAKGTYVGESLILYSHGGSPYVYEKSGIK